MPDYDIGGGVDIVTIGSIGNFYLEIDDLDHTASVPLTPDMRRTLMAALAEIEAQEEAARILVKYPSLSQVAPWMREKEEQED